jgi:hypothetical protein
MSSPSVTPDIVLGGRQLKQPNPPVSPRWDTDPLRPEDIKPMHLPKGVTANIDNAPLTQPKMDTSNPATTQVLSGLSGVRKNPVK